MALLRREAERSDFGVSSFLLLQSLAGGTGSGVGARVSELLRDEFGNRSVIANALVAP
jgi:tubulin delta